MSNKFNEELYDISQYNDKELYEVLDLFNPSDRELEAKIIFYINKYSAIENGAILVRFFEDVYNHFFDNDSDDEHTEGFDNLNTEYSDETNADYVSNVFKTSGYINSGNIITGNNISTPVSLGNAITGNITTEIIPSSPIIIGNVLTSGIPEYDDNKKPSEDNIAKLSSINKDVAFTTTLDYAKGQLNPLLKQTTTRILSVDSQYREDKSSLTTSFSFDLSEPLRDVVSLKLYSFQIPYTWYTIGKGFGSNFFYLKGAASGINNGNHDIQIAINPGNYTPSELSTAVDNAITSSKSIYTEVNFGTTNIKYNANTSLSTLTIDINNLYNENSYYLNFPEFKSPYQLDNNRKTSIPSFLGFQTGNYSTNSVKSAASLPLLTDSSLNEITTNDNLPKYLIYGDAEFIASINGTTMTVSEIVSGEIYIGQIISGTGVISGTTVTAKISGISGIGTYSVSKTHQTVESTTIKTNSANNYFTVIKYIGPDEYTEKSVIDKEFNIAFSLTTPGLYSRNDLVLDLSNQLHNCIYLDKTYKIGSSILRRNIDPSNNGYNVNKPINSYYELKIKPNRKTTNNIDNSKIALKFPIENLAIAQSIVPSSSPVWKGKQSCFCFDPLKTYYETNTIYAENKLLNEQQIFIINDNVNIYLKCVHDGFVLPENDITIHIPFYGKADDNITYLPYPDLNSYITAINDGIKAADNTYGGSLNTANFGGTGGTKAYIDTNGYFKIYLDVEKTFDESTYIMDLTDSIFNTNNIKIVDDITNSSILTDLTKTYTTFVNTGGLFVNSDTILAVIKPKPGSTAGNRNDVTYTLRFGYDKSYTDYTFFEDDVNNIFNNYVDPISGRNIFAGIDLVHETTKTGYQISLKIKISKKLVSKNYSVNFSDTPPTTGTWYASWRNYLFIDTIMFNQDYNLEVAFNSPSINTIINGKDEYGNDIVILTINNYNEVTAHGISAIEDNKMTIQRGVNNIINIIAYEDGVETLGLEKPNDLKIDILNGMNSNTLDITVNNLIKIINAQFDNSLYFKGSKLSTYYIDNQNYLKIRMNINRKYKAKDYKLVFYDEVSFVKCYVGTTSVQNTTWDSTLGWILGYREYTSYNLTDTALYSSTSGLYSINESTNIVTIIGDTGVCTNLYNYFLICLDDYNQNHLNDGLVTITNRDNNIALPSYGSKSSFACDPGSGQLTYNTSLVTDGSHLTAKQIYALTAIANNQYNSEAMGTSVSAKSYGTGPFAKDVFAILPMKVAGLANGSSYMEYGGTLQNQSRNYFGPVNIRRMSVSLISDRGNKVDLNNANWSFSIICEQLNKLTPAK